MWAKDYYQENMLGYLSWVETEIAQLEQARIRHRDLNQLYDDLEVALERLWRLIEATEFDWERFRYPLEVSCNILLRKFNQVPQYTSILIYPIVLTVIDEHESLSELRK